MSPLLPPAPTLMLPPLLGGAALGVERRPRLNKKEGDRQMGNTMLKQ
jgi:hypothetical protein